MGPAIRLWLTALVSVLILAACGQSSEEAPELEASAGLRVASFDFAESALLAEMYSQVLESVGVPVVRLGAVGPREIVAPALELDRIDLVPEYVGTALAYHGGGAADPDPVSALSARLAPRGLVALEPSPAVDSNVIVVTVETAQRHDLESISDLASVAAEQRFGGPPECPDRRGCLLGLESVYQLRFAEFVPQRSLVVTAEALRRGEIDVGLMFSTASELETDDLIQLTDDRNLQPPENVVPVLRAAAIERWGPIVATSLDAVSGRLTTSDLRALNLRVTQGEPVEAVAADWLSRNDLLDNG